jgi:hypothetical protein
VVPFATVQFDTAALVNYTITHKIDGNIPCRKLSVSGFEFQASGFPSIFPDNTKSETRNSWPFPGTAGRSRLGLQKRTGLG